MKITFHINFYIHSRQNRTNPDAYCWVLSDRQSYVAEIMPEKENLFRAANFALPKY